VNRSTLFKAYGKFLLLLMLAIIFPDLSHQHLNFGTFSEPVRMLGRYGILFIALGVVVKSLMYDVVQRGGTR